MSSFVTEPLPELPSRVSPGDGVPLSTSVKFVFNGALSYDVDYARTLRGNVASMAPKTTLEIYPEPITPTPVSCVGLTVVNAPEPAQRPYPAYHRPLTIEDLLTAVPMMRYFRAIAVNITDHATGAVRVTGIRNEEPLGLCAPDISAGARAIERMDRIFTKHGTDKASGHHNYVRQYARVLDPYRHLPRMRYLELGILHGASMRAAREFFPNAQALVGIDINMPPQRFPEVGVTYVQGDASDGALLRRVSAEHGPFDVIIDDASHQLLHVMHSFASLWALLADGGIYIVEDINVGNCEWFTGTGIPNPPPHMRDHHAFFADKARILANHGIAHEYWRVGEDYHSNPDRIRGFKSDDPVVQGLDQVVFGVGWVALTKRIRAHWVI